MASVLYGASGARASRRAAPVTELPPMEGTGFLTMMPTAPALPLPGPEGAWLDAADLDAYTAGFASSGFFGPVSYYRNLDANFEVMAGARRRRGDDAERVHLRRPIDPVRQMDPAAIERMHATAARLPWRHPDRRRRPLDPAGGPGGVQRRPAGLPRRRR